MRTYLCGVELLSKSKQATFRRLADKKFRLESGLCVAEGFKCILDCMALGWKPDWLGVDAQQVAHLDQMPKGDFPVYLLPESGLSFLENPTGLVGVFRIPDPRALPQKGPIVVLDGIQDPGNMGTILRSCHWFGIEDVVLLKGTVDPYGPKVVQASMGSIAAVNLHRLRVDELRDWIMALGLKLLLAEINGKPMTEIPYIPSDKLGWVIGNEGNGIGPEVAEMGTSVRIPSFSVGLAPESLNAATALSVMLGHHFLTKG